MLGRLTIADAADFIDRYLPPRDRPPTNAGSPDHDLAVQVITASAGPLGLARTSTWRNGMEDTSGWIGGPHDEWFRAFPTAQASRAIANDNDMLGEPAYRFWFLLRDDEPVLCIETPGTAHTCSGTTMPLRDLGQSPNVIAARLHDEVVED